MIGRESIIESRSDELTISVSVLISASFWLSVGGVNPIQSAVSILVVLLLGQFGFLTLRLLFSDPVARKLTETWSARLGPAVGVGLFGLFLLRSITSRLIFLLLLSLLLLATFVSLAREFLNLHAAHNLKNLITPVKDWFWQVPATIAVLGLLLSADWWWTLPTVFTALLATLLCYPRSTQRIGFRTNALMCVVLVAVGCTISLGIRADLWWISYNNDDDLWFQITAHGLIEWGPFVRPDMSANGGLPASAYHYLAYFLAGLLNLVWPSETMFAVTRLLPVATGVVTLSSLQFFLRANAGLSQSWAFRDQKRFFCLIAFSVGVTVAGIPSDFLGSAMLIGFIGFVPSISAERKLTRYLALVFLATAIVAFSKGPFAYAVPLMLAPFALSGDRRLIRFTVPVLTSLLVFAFFRQSNLSSSVVIGFFSEESLGEHAFAGGIAGRILAILFVAAPLSLGLYSSALLVFRRELPREIRILTLGLTAVIAAAMCSRFILDTDPRRISYFFRPGLIASGLAVLLYAEHSAKKVPTRSVLTALLLLAIFTILLWSFVIQIFVPNMDSGSIAAKLLRMIREINMINLLLLSLLPLYLLVKCRLDSSHILRIRFRYFLRSSLLPLFLLVATGLQPNLTNFKQRLSETTAGEEDRWRESVIGNYDARDVSRALQKVNRDDELVALTICGKDVRGQCFSPLIFAAYSGSRFLNVWSETSKDWDFPNAASRDDFNLTLSLFDKTPSVGIEALRSRGVTLLVVDMNEAPAAWDLKKLRSLSRVLYANKSFALLRLQGSAE